MIMRRRLLGTLAGILSAVLAPSAAALAQSAPAGNAHPERVLVSGTDAPAAAAFGIPQPVSALTPEGKAAFAEAVDLSPLADLAVLHNGRVKIIDTLANETVRSLTGRDVYLERILAPGAAFTPPEGTPDATWRYHESPDLFNAYRFDPVFTLIDLAIDPAYYQHRPLITVDYLPLREELLLRAVRAMGAQGDDVTDRVEMWKRSGRVTPGMVDAFAPGIFTERVANAGISAEPYRRGINAAERSRDLYRFSASNLMVVAPESRDDTWHRLTDLDPAHPVRQAANALGIAWRAGDAAGANAAIATLAEELPRVNAELYPQGRRTLELAYNRSNAFEWGFWIYLVALISLLLAFGTQRKWLVVFGATALVAAVLLHGFGFTARCIIAERLAIQNQFESMTGLSLLASVVGTAIMLARKQWLFGAAAAAVGFMVLIVATQTGIPGVTIEREAAILNTSVLLKYHVTTVLASYGLIALGFICSLFYLGAHYGHKLFGQSEAQTIAKAALSGDGTTPASTTHARLLGDLDSAQMIVLQLAFWTLGVGILLGAWWADHSWGRWWAFDPKETWALITWIVYLIVIHVRRGAPQSKGLTTAWLSVAGFIVMLWTYFGVNLLLPGLHAYA